MWEPHPSLLMLEQNVEVLSAYQEWTCSWAGCAGLVGHRHSSEHGLCLSGRELELLQEMKPPPAKPGDQPVLGMFLSPSCS